MFSFKNFFLFLQDNKNYKKNKTDKDKPKLQVNSPAKVLGMFPPHIECDSMKRKAKEDIAAIIGIGNLKFINLKKRNAAMGNDKIPKIVINLNETSRGIKQLSRAINAKGNGK